KRNLFAPPVVLADRRRTETDMTENTENRDEKNWFDRKPTRYLLIAVAMVLVLVAVYFGTKGKRAELASVVARTAFCSQTVSISGPSRV
ncbi:MAG: hypothetical protein WCS71_03645, partial [Sphaerochaetaceae bacterium]